MEDYPAIEQCKQHSDSVIETLRARLKLLCDSSDICIVVVGSYARREASPLSDLDFFILHNEESNQDAEMLSPKVNALFEELGLKLPSKGGAFNQLESRESMLSNIGGQEDNNEHLTRRMLFLLECECLFNSKYFETLFEEMLSHYVKEGITQHQLCRFLLNDMIRYYRTICVDFEYKTHENNKSWGDRNIKLMFSRKLLYFSGILAIAKTVQHTGNEKRRILFEHLRKTPLERISTICGSQNIGDALTLYDHFLSQLGDKNARALLNKAPLERTEQSEEFRTLKNKGHHFSWELANLLKKTFDSSHPIHHAITF